MPLRQFVDSKGVRWKVWDITPAQVHPRVKEEKFFIGYELGWLAFESEGGEIRRRLCPCPARWEALPAEELEGLCREAEPVTPRLRPTDASDVEVGRKVAEDLAVARLSVEAREAQEAPPDERRARLRTFQYPGGQMWTVGTLTTSDERGRREVLRFLSGLHSVDLERWPDDWERFSDAELAALLRTGAPPRSSAQNPTPHRRRHDDLRP